MFASFFRRLDWMLILPVTVLLTLSQITLFTLDHSLFRSQLIFTFLSVILFFIFSQISIKSLSLWKTPIYIISLICLLFLLFVGLESHGAVRWLDLFGFRVQFSEIFKPFLCLCLAAFLSAKEDRSLKRFLVLLTLLAFPAFFIYKQPDLGTALIYVFTALLTSIIYGFPLWWFGVAILTVVGSIPLLWNFLHEYQKQRVLTFLHITNDPLGNSYNAIQAVIAVGSGMFIGKGFGQGTQANLRFLPEKQTDFIFATLSEDLGFIGGVLIITAFLFLLYRFYQIYQDTPDTLSKLFVASAFSLIFIQCFINIGMNIGIMPVVGVTLPFVSYGGSSLLSNAILLGLVASIGSLNKKKHVLEIK